MNLLKNIWIVFISATFLSLPPAVSAWNQRSYHKDHRDYYEKSYDRHHKKYRHQKKFHPKKNPSWENYQHRLQHRFNFREHNHKRYRFHDHKEKRYRFRDHNEKRYRFRDHSYNRYREYRHDETPSHGWELVKKGRSQKALNVFSRIANRYPYDGEPKIGYAVAAAQSRQMYDGVRAMRRALRYDPDSLDRIRVDGKLYDELYELAKGYQRRTHGLDSADRHFMAASLYYLIGERENYLEALEKNHEADDRSQSTMNLYRLAGYDGHY